MDMLVTAFASAVCFDPQLNILNISDRQPAQEIEWPEMVAPALGIDIKAISLTPTDNTYYLSEAEQRVFARTLLRSVRVLDEGSFLR